MKKIQLVERFEQSVRDHDNAGAQPVEDRMLIEAEYREAKINLVAALRTPVNDRVPSGVTVPLDLLKEVLDQAESDNHDVEGERACNDIDRAGYAAERAKIDQLRQIAGLPIE